MVIIAERIVKVRLVAEAAGYMQGVDAAAKKTRELGTEAEKLAQKREAFNLLGAAALGFGAAAGAGVALAVSKFAEFDQQMSYVQAATHETAANMDLLRDAAMDAGARTVFSATEAAQAIEELSKAGVSTADILGGALDGALDAAAAGGMEVAATAELMASTLSQFNLEGGEASHVADLLAAGAGKAQGDMADLGAALSQAGLVANQFGLSVDDTVGTLAAFANAGMMGSDAGTSLRTMLLRLANPTKEVSDLMQATGIQAYNAAGEFVGLDALAGQLQASLGDMTQAQRDQTLAMIFGQDAIRGANILMNEGTEGIQEWTNAVNDQGYAAETAAIRLDNLKGDWEALTGAVDTALISMGEGANGPLREFVQGLTGLVDNFNDLPDWAQQSALGVGAVGAAAATAAGLFLLGVPKVAQYREALATMGTGAQRAGRFVSALGRTAAVVGGLVALGVAANAAAEGMGMAGGKAKSLESTMKSLLGQDFDAPFADLSSEVTDLASGLDILLGGDFNAQAERFGSSLNSIFFGGSLADQVSETRKQFETMGESLAELVQGGEADRAAEMFDEIAAAAEKQGYSVEQVSELMPAYQDALDGASNSATLAAESTDEATAAVEGVSEAAQAAEKNLDALKESLDAIGGTARDMGAAQDEAMAAINSLTEAAQVQGVAIDGTNDASIAFRDSLREAETTARDAAVAMIENGLSTDEATAAYHRSREAILDQIAPYFKSRDAAAAWADKNLGSAREVEGGLRDVADAANSIPPNKSIGIHAETASAVQKLADVKAWADSIPSIKRVTLETIEVRSLSGQGRVLSADGNATGNYYHLGKPKEFAAGGWASGIYPYTPGGIHKFAEAYDEAYITMQPSHRERSLDIWAEVGNRLGAWAPASSSAVAAAPMPEPVSFDGASITGRLEIGGDGLARIIDGRISTRDAQAARTVRAGRQVR